MCSANAPDVRVRGEAHHAFMSLSPDMGIGSVNREPKGVFAYAWGSQRLRTVSGQQRAVNVVARVCAVMFDTTLPIRTQIVETQAVFFQQDFSQKF